MHKSGFLSFCKSELAQVRSLAFVGRVVDAGTLEQCQFGKNVDFGEHEYILILINLPYLQKDVLSSQCSKCDSLYGIRYMANPRQHPCGAGISKNHHFLQYSPDWFV